MVEAKTKIKSSISYQNFDLAVPEEVLKGRGVPILKLPNQAGFFAKADNVIGPAAVSAT